MGRKHLWPREFLSPPNPAGNLERPPCGVGTIRKSNRPEKKPGQRPRRGAKKSNPPPNGAKKRKRFPKGKSPREKAKFWGPENKKGNKAPCPRPPPEPSIFPLAKMFFFFFFPPGGPGQPPAVRWDGAPPLGGGPTTNNGPGNACILVFHPAGCPPGV